MIRTLPFRTLLGTGLVLALLGTTRPARADEDSTTTAAARERFKEGVTYFDQKQYEKARAAFLQAYALKKHPAVLLNLAQSELRSNHEQDAAEHFAQFLREADEASQAERDAAQAGLASAKTAICEIDVATEPDADITVDGELQGVAPLPGALYLEPGSHTIQARRGDRVVSETVVAKAGETEHVRLELAPASPAAKPASARSAAPAGAAEPPETSEEPAKPAGGGREPFFHWLLTKPAGVITGGATLLLGGGAVGFAVAANVNYSDADDIAQQIDDRARADGVSTQGICVDPKQVLPPGSDAEAASFLDACSHRQDAVDRGDSYKNIAMFTGIGAGVLAATTVVLYFVTADREETAAQAGAPRVAVLPWAGPAGGGVSVAGRF